MKHTIENATKIAMNEVGYLEKKSNKDLDSKTKNAGRNNYQKYSIFLGDQACYWCAYFICWVFYTLCGNSKAAAKEMLCGCLSGACETIRYYFVKANRYYKTPKVGDLIFFTGTRHSGANHIGYVYKVTSTRVYTIEGNSSDGHNVIDNGGKVCCKDYPLGYSKIMGYGRPRYEVDGKTYEEANKKCYLPKELPERGWFKAGDTGKDSLRINKFLNWALDAKLPLVEEYTKETANNVKAFQKQVVLSADGEWGKDTQAAAKEYRK